MSAPPKPEFTQYVQLVHQRTEALYQQAREAPWRQPELVLRCLEELHVALEELHVAEEELRQQNEQLIRSQQALETRQRQYQELFEFAPDGYIVTDSYGTMQEVNRVAAVLLNRAPKNLIGKPLSAFVPLDQRPSFRAVLNQLPTIHRVQDWEISLLRQGSGTFEAALTVESIQDDGQAVGLRWLIRDATTRKRAEAQLRQIQLQNLELLEADRLKNMFLATISHELRTPLNAILGFSYLLQRRLNQCDWQGSEMVERIVENGQHLLELIEQMLDFSKLKAQGPELQLETFDLVDLARLTVEELRPLAEQKSLTLELEEYPTALHVDNDRLRMRQILTNLITNGIKFTERGSVIVQIWELPEGQVALLVRDTGIGISAADRDHIFREFWQVNQGTTRQAGGTGLGLAIVQTLVRSMGGSIGVESRPHQGSTFRVELPRRVRRRHADSQLSNN